METQEISTAEELINETIVSREESSVISTLNRKKEALEAQERARVNRYIEAMRPIYAAMIVDNFGGNTAGLYDGSAIYIDQRVTMIESSVDATIDQSREVYDHERYHQMNAHTAPLRMVDDTRSDIAAVIGGVEFTQTALIEGLTVKQTGDQFVSVQYLEYEHMVDRALGSSGLTVGVLEEAVNNQKDLTLVDDRTRGPQHPAEQSHVMSA